MSFLTGLARMYPIHQGQTLWDDSFPFSIVASPSACADCKSKSYQLRGWFGLARADRWRDFRLGFAI